jgi:DNA helicase II / ATP-dependent DNA helicase PcrA
MKYTVLDLETTGVSTLKDEPVQIAAITFEVIKGVYMETQSLDTLIIPGVAISEGAAKVHGISMKKARSEGLAIPIAVPLILNYFWKAQPCALIGYNLINFDLPMLWNWLAKYNPSRFKFPPVSLVYDVMFMVQSFLGARKWPKLEAAAKALNVPLPKENLHDAFVDVELTWAVFRALEARTKK